MATPRMTSAMGASSFHATLDWSLFFIEALVPRISCPRATGWTGSRCTVGPGRAPVFAGLSVMDGSHFRIP